jgi:molybdopterin/thiamine biosynthesis adenylyltransferase
MIDCSLFYQERDHRTNLTLPQAPSPVPLAISIGPAWAETVNGQLALYWLSSLISRMGQRFNRLMIFLPQKLAALPCLIPGLNGTFGDAILEHLRASDPCGDYHIVTELKANIPMISVGSFANSSEQIVIEPRGWSAVIGTASTVPVISHANEWVNPIGAALAASLGATEIYFQVNQQSLSGRRSQVPLWISARHSAVTTSGDEAANWNDDTPLPNGINIGRWLVVGAGALGGNALAILGMARENLNGSIDVVDPDIVDLSNLNRLVEALAAHARVLKKVDLATLSFRESNVKVVPHDMPYERLRNVGELSIEVFDLVMTGVDQMSTRAFVQSDWPRFLVDGGTRGYTWRVSTIENSAQSPCLGCLAGKSQQQYRDLTSPLGCAIGLSGQVPAIVPSMDSYSFVSFFGATFMAARAIEKSMAIPPLVSRDSSTEAVALNLRQLQHKQELPSQSCLCMCSHPMVREYRQTKFGHT